MGASAGKLDRVEEHDMSPGFSLRIPSRLNFFRIKLEKCHRVDDELNRRVENVGFEILLLR
jgi:hypothetical protein